MIQWIETHRTILTWLTAVSMATTVACLIVVPFLIVRIPSNYFVYGSDSRKVWVHRHLIARSILIIAKNLFGYVLVVAGILMLVLPGQGVLTILVGIMLLNFPGKYELERWIVTRQPVLRSINWIRRRGGKGPLIFEE